MANAAFCLNYPSFPILLAGKLGEGRGDVLLREAVEGSLVLDAALCGGEEIVRERAYC